MSYLKPHACQAGGHPRDSAGGDSLNVPFVFGVGLHAFFIFNFYFFIFPVPYIPHKRKTKKKNPFYCPDFSFVSC